jgi:RimJ/RimL family protein N-acetyltransferase
MADGEADYSFYRGFGQVLRYLTFIFVHFRYLRMFFESRLVLGRAARAQVRWQALGQGEHPGERPASEGEVAVGDCDAESECVSHLAGGTAVTLRLIEPEDAERLRRLFYRLSPETVYWRFFTPIRAPREKVLEHFAQVDHQRRDAVVAVSADEVVGVARYDQAEGTEEVDTAILVEDAWQGRGLAKVLLRRLAEVACGRGIRTFTALILGENVRARRLYSAVFTDIDAELDGSVWHLRISLAGPHAGCR